MVVTHLRRLREEKGDPGPPVRAVASRDLAAPPGRRPRFSLDRRGLLLTSLLAPSECPGPPAAPVPPLVSTSPSQGASLSSRPGSLVTPSSEGRPLCWGPSKPTPACPSPSSGGHTASQGQGGTSPTRHIPPRPVPRPALGRFSLPHVFQAQPNVGAEGTRDSHPHQGP